MKNKSRLLKMLVFIGVIAILSITGLSCLQSSVSWSSSVVVEKPFVPVSTASPFSMFTITASGDSTPLQWTKSGGSTHWQLVKEYPSDSNGTYVYTSTNAYTDTFDMLNVSSGGGIVPANSSIVIDHVSINYYARKATTPTAVKITVKPSNWDLGTSLMLPTALTNTYALRTNTIYTLYTGTSSERPITYADINLLKISITSLTTVIQIRFSTIYVDVYWKYAVRPTINILPYNGTNFVDYPPICHVSVTDGNTNKYYVGFQDNSSGWKTRQINGSWVITYVWDEEWGWVEVNTSIDDFQWNDTYASYCGSWFWWRVWVNDSFFNTTYGWFKFYIKCNGPPVITVIWPLDDSNVTYWNGSTMFTVFDPDGDYMQFGLLNNISGSWKYYYFGDGYNGTYWSIGDLGSWIHDNDGGPWNGTRYYWKLEATDLQNLSDSSIRYVYPPVWSFRLRNNSFPVISNMYPSNGSITDVDYEPSMSVQVNDSDGDLMDLLWLSNSSGAWLPFSSEVNVPNGTYSKPNTNFSEYGTRYYWSVAVYDHYVTASSGMYYFGTASLNLTVNKIENNCTISYTSHYNKYTGWTVNITATGNTTPIHTTDIKTNCTGSLSYIKNDSGYWITSNHVGLNALNFIEHFVNATGAHQSYWTGTQWNIYPNATGNTTPVTLHSHAVNSVINLMKILRGSGGWDVYGNSTGNSSGSLVPWLTIINPNPGNGNHKTNYLKKASNLTTSLDVISKNLTNTYVYAGGQTTNKVFQYWTYNMTKKAETASYGGTIEIIAQDDNYIYVGGDTTQKIYQYWISNLSKKAESTSYGGTINALAQDSVYIYAGGYTTQKIYQYWKSNLTKKAETTDYGGTILELTSDTTYVYAGGSTTNKIYQYWKSNLTKKAETASYGGTISSITQDDNYVYAAGGVQKVFQYWKSNLTKKAETASYGGGILIVINDDVFVYAGGFTTGKVYQYWKTNMTKKAQTTPYASTISGLAQDTNYIYAGGQAPTQKVYRYWKSNMTKKAEALAYGGNILALSNTEYVNMNWSRNVNITWSSNSSGSWLPFAYSTVDHNGTYTVSALNFNNIGTYYWKAECESNHHTWFNTSVFSFTTINASTAIHLFQTFINATGTHQYILNDTGYQVWSNATGNTTPVNLHSNALNTTLSLTKTLRGSGGWDVYGNSTAPLNFILNITNAIVTHQNHWTGSQQNIFINGTGNGSIPYVMLHNPNPANGSTYWNSNFINYNPNGLALSVDLNSTDWNYGGFPDNLHLFFNIYNDTMVLIDNQDIEDCFTNGTYTIFSNTINQQNATYYWQVTIWSNNHMGNIYSSMMYIFTTARTNYTISLYQNITNATGTHIFVFNGSGYQVYANYNGNTTAVNLHQDIINAYGTHIKLLRGFGGWDVYANYTGAGASGGDNELQLINPNPGNGTHNTNYLLKNNSGLTTSIDVNWKNFTVPAILNITGLWQNTTNTANISLDYNLTRDMNDGYPGYFSCYVGQEESAGFYTIWRGMLFFNTSNIPTDAIIDNAMLQMTVQGDDAPIYDYSVVIQKGDSMHPHIPIDTGDYNRTYYTGNYGSTNTSTGYLVNHPFNIIFNPGGLSLINRTGVTNLVLRTDREIAGQTPPTSIGGYPALTTVASFYGYLYTSNPAYYPRLFITYHVPINQHKLNITWLSNSSNLWLPYAYSNMTINGTSTVNAANFSNVGKYWWRACAEGNHTSYYNTTIFEFETNVTAVPKEITIYNPSPANESTGIAFNRLLGVMTYVYIDSNVFGLSDVDVVLSSNSSGVWLPYHTTVLSSPGIVYKQNFNFNRPGKTYWWKVTATDADDANVNATVTYHFTTVVRPFGSIRVYGTEYSPTEPGTIYAQILFDDGTPSNISSPLLTVWEKASKYIDGVSMTYIAGSNGCYYYNFAVPSNINVFLADVRSDDPVAFGSSEFHVSEWSSAIPHINETVNDINNTVNDINGTVNNINTTVNQLYRMLWYINNTYLPVINTNVNSIYSLCHSMDVNATATYAQVNAMYNYVWKIYNISLYLNGTIWGNTAISGMLNILHYINDTRWDGYNMSDIYNIVDNIQNVVLSINTTTTSVLSSKLDNLSILCNSINGNLASVSIDIDSIYNKVYAIYNISLYLNGSWGGGTLSTNILNVLNYINDTRWDGLDASDIYMISNDIKNIVSAINATTNSLGNGFEVRLTNFGEITPGKNYLAQVTIFNSDGTMMNPDVAPRISLYDSAGNNIINDMIMAFVSTGQYSYSYTTVAGQPAGQWTTITKTIVHGNQVKNIGYWQLESNPPKVTAQVIDDCILSTKGKIEITNEGTGDQEYYYYWWVTPRAAGDYADIDTVDSGSASKLIAPLNTFMVVEPFTVPTIGTYWFKVRVYYDTEMSGASAQFTAISCGGGGAGGGVSPGQQMILTILTIDQDGNRISSAIVSIYDGTHILGTKQTNETGFAKFSLPLNSIVRVTVSKDGYLSTEKTIMVTKTMTETITMNKVGMEGWMWWLVLFGIIGTFAVIVYLKKRPEKRRVI